MNNELNRYFIELQPKPGPTPPRWRETEIRREAAAAFITTISDWLKRNELNDKVAAMAITALGQVQITCEANVISHIRSEEELNIAAIRQGVPFADASPRRSLSQ